MEVVVSVPGQFWAFNVAEKLNDEDSLRQLITSHPRFAFETTVPKENISTVVHPELVFQAGRRLPELGLCREMTDWNRPFLRWKMRAFDRAVARQLPAPSSDSALFVGYSGTVQHSVQRANELGYTTVVERASSHIRTQASLLAKEHEIFESGPGPISDRHIQIEEQEYRTADYVVVPSRFVAQTFVENGYPNDKILKIPFGYEVDKQSLGPTDDPPVFLFAGTASLRKGIQYLLKAWEEADMGKSTLLVAGNIDSKVRTLVDDYRNDSSIKFLGWVDNIEELYRRASVFVLPTIEEGSARVTYEAMAHECPVITTPNSGWVGDDGTHGIEVPIRDTRKLAEALEQLKANPSRRAQYGANARALITEQYTQQQYLESVISTYRTLTGESEDDLPTPDIPDRVKHT